MQNCPNNYYYKDGICIQCPTGYFAHVINADRCYPCSTSDGLNCTGDIPKMKTGYYNYIQNNS